MKDLVVINDGGVRENCGALAEKRTVGKTEVYLTYDEPRRFWWIIWKDAIDERLRKLGFVVERREECWETFHMMTEASLAKLRSN